MNPVAPMSPLTPINPVDPESPVQQHDTMALCMLVILSDSRPIGAMSRHIVAYSSGACKKSFRAALLQPSVCLFC